MKACGIDVKVEGEGKVLRGYNRGEGVRSQVEPDGVSFVIDVYY